MGSKRHLRQRACGDKIRYESQDKAAEQANHDRRKFHTFVVAYKCPFSGQTPHYHVGHPDARTRQQMAARRRGDA